MNKEEILKYVSDIVKHQLPYKKFSPCKSCSKYPSCGGCDDYYNWRKEVEDNPIQPGEQENIEFIHKLKTIISECG